MSTTATKAIIAGATALAGALVFHYYTNKQQQQPASTRASAVAKQAAAYRPSFEVVRNVALFGGATYLLHVGVADDLFGF
jgi:uncharacterized membrane protein YebE (DUF533 family)